MTRPFRSLRPTRPKLFVGVIYSAEHPIAGPRAWAITLVDADDEEQAAAQLMDSGQEVLIGKDVEFYAAPREMAKHLTHVQRNIPLGDGDPVTAEVKSVIGEWLSDSVLRRRERDMGRPAREVAVAHDGDAVMVGEIVRKPEVLH